MDWSGAVGSSEWQELVAPCPPPPDCLTTLRLGLFFKKNQGLYWSLLPLFVSTSNFNILPLKMELLSSVTLGADAIT